MDFSESELIDLRRALRVWFLANRRPLPWREDPSVYGTLVSEFMCQQTQVDMVIPYFHRWMDRLPDIDALATADDAVVLKLWEGLGYYRRARNLLSIARSLVTMGEVPRTAKEWRKLPGIGEYTAAAIASMRFDEPVAVVDGNVVRVVARLTGDRRRYRNPGEAVKRMRPAAEMLLDSERPGLHNEAMMELGATVCRKRGALCGGCPLQAFCPVSGAKDVDSIPLWQTRSTRKERIQRAWACADGKLLLQRLDKPDSSLHGMYELPVWKDLAESPPSGEPLLKGSRGIGQRMISEEIYLLKVPMQLTPGKGFHWVDASLLKQITLSGPHRKWVDWLKNQRKDKR